VTVLLAALLTLAAQAAPEHLVRAADQPRNWLTYSGTYSGQRYSTLAQIDRTNVKNLEVKWLLQNQVAGPWESSPLVVDGIMYLTQRPNDVIALDARTGRIFWIYKYTGSPEFKACCGANNRGLAILGGTLFMGTLDAHLVALDAKSGRVLWLGPPREASNTAIVKAGSLLLLLNDDAQLIVARSSRTGLEPLKRYIVADSATWAQPAVSGNRLFVKDVASLSLWTLQ